jgi:putative LysE/RhtB family amino acid efflux pump
MNGWSTAEFRRIDRSFQTATRGGARAACRRHRQAVPLRPAQSRAPAVSADAAAGFGLGLFFAAQIGPVTLLIIRSVLRGRRGFAVGLAMASAVASVDVLYSAVGLAGVGRLLSGEPIRLAFGLASASILVVIGVRTLWTGLRARSGLELEDEVVVPRAAFATAVAATALNPLTIALWTIAFPAAAPSAATDSVADAAVVVIGVAVGTLTWYCGFAAFVAAVGKYVGDRILRAIDVLIGAGLVGFGSFLGYRAVAER